MYSADKTLSPEKLMLEASFTRLISLFEEYKRTTDAKMASLDQTIENQKDALASFEEEYHALLDSLKNITVLPDEHDWALKIKYLRQNVSDLLNYSLEFSAYADERLNLYSQMTR